MIWTVGVALRVPQCPTTPAQWARLLELPRPTGTKGRDLRRSGTPRDQRELGHFANTDAVLRAATLAHPILMERSAARRPRGEPLCRPAGRVREVLSVV